MADTPKATLHIGPLTYTVSLEDNIPDPDGDDTLLGHILYTQGTISVLKDMAPDFRMVALWHEIIHGILFQYGLDTGETLKVPREQLIEALSFGIFDVLKKNPWWARANVSQR